jgi:uncharacterized protein YbjT (DUF2867 family)
MTVKVVIAGGSGLVGRQAAEMLALAGFEVHLVSRRASKPPHPAIKEHIAALTEWPAIVTSIKPAIAISCLGTTIRTAGSRDAFRAVDHELVLAFAQASQAAGAQHLITVSSVGAVPASSNFYLQTKADMEQGLRDIGFRRLDIMRPSLLTGGHRADRRPGEALGILLSPLFDMLMIGRLGKFASTPSDKVAKAIAALASTSDEGVFIHENDSINTLAG